jgi:hypothetical protein
MNAKVGAEIEGLEHIRGKYGLGNRNRNGELFVDLCNRENMVIGGTLFPHKNCHKVTWISPDHNTENQTDHFAISRNWRSLRDVRNKRGADIGSDHHLVVALFKLKVLASQRKFQTCERRFNTDYLKHTEVKKKFKIKLQNRYQELQRAAGQNEDIEEMLNEAKSALIKITEEMIGYRERNRKEWMNSGTWNTIKQRREAKMKLNMATIRQHKTEKSKEYSQLNQQVKKQVRRDKRR